MGTSCGALELWSSASALRPGCARNTESNARTYCLQGAGAALFYVLVLLGGQPSPPRPFTPERVHFWAQLARFAENFGGHLRFR